MLVTFFQLAQMVAGVIILLITGFNYGSSCGRWALEDPIGLNATLFMYASYMVLFAKLFYEKYIRPKKVAPVKEIPNTKEKVL